MSPDPGDLPGDLAPLFEASADLQSDAIRATGVSLAELPEAPQRVAPGEGASDDELAENRAFALEHRRSLERSLSRAGILGVAGGGALVTLLASAASASSSADVQMLQTAASIETLAVGTYGTALTLPYIGGASANGVVKKFCQVTMAQHAQHRAAFNSAVRRLGGKEQTKPDPAFVPVVNKAVSGLSGATASAGMLGVIALALELENVAAETYVNDVSNLKNANAKRVTASIMGVEAQHAAVLRAVQALLQANAPQLVTLSASNVASLPSAAGSVGFPDAFYPTSAAAPRAQGAVK
ncbi:MAG TPA: ferritin-like domain-containing protein [Acidimicrobiales bacterium]|nr:ferritin-like domain-containing protein [Acidimicrobiales bacterium]